MEETMTPGEEQKSTSNLEKALASTEADAMNTQKALHLVGLALKKYLNATKIGNLKEIQTAINEVEKSELALRQQVAVTKEGWNFDIDAYLGGSDFIKEILAVAEQKGVRIFERDDRLYCYPVLVRVLPSERTVLIDKAKEKRLRPTVLVNRLKELQKKPPRFRPDIFLEALHSAYRKAAQIKGTHDKNSADAGTVISLLDIYELFTLLPGQSKEYSRQEFARDIFLLDRSGVNETKDGAKLSLPASTGTKIASRTLNIINEFGEEKRYYGIAFTKEQ